jgi:hypothetical protein
MAYNTNTQLQPRNQRNGKKYFPQVVKDKPGKTQALDVNNLPQGTAYGSDGSQSAISKEYPVIATPDVLTFTLTADNTYVAGTDVPLLPSMPSETTLPQGVTFSSANFASYTDFVTFISGMRPKFGYLLVSTDNNANFNLSLKYTKRGVTGASFASTVAWNAFTKDFNSYDQTAREILNTGWIAGNPYLKVSLDAMTASSSITFNLHITGFAGAYDFIPSQL